MNLKNYFLAAIALVPLTAFAAGPSPLEKKATYSSAGLTFTPPTNPTDLCSLVGKDNKVIKVTEIRFSSTQSTAGMNLFYVIKRNSSYAGGTFAALTSVPHDSLTGASGSAGASVGYWLGNPSTLGAFLGYITTWQALSPAPASVAQGAQVVMSFGENSNVGFSQPITLRGSTDVVALSFNGQTLPSGMVVSCAFTWTEE